MAIIVSGGAGFIGSKLVKHFITQGHDVLVLDNLSRGSMAFFDGIEARKNLHFVCLDLAEEPATYAAMAAFHARYPVTAVWHMAANSDIQAGISDTHIDLRDTFLSTFSILEAMKKLNIPSIAFASSSAIYGDLGPDVRLHEEIGPLLPISNYGAMKLASEALISAATESWLKRALVFRFPNVVGIPATHGVILDFVRKLKESGTLQVLGNGTQQKVYLHVDDLIDAMIFIATHALTPLNIFNIGPDDSGCSVRDIAESVVTRVHSGAAIVYGEESRGWVGDVPRFAYSVDKLAALGWKTSHTSREAVQKAVGEIAWQEGVKNA